jgi:hypothetical protein
MITKGSTIVRPYKSLGNCTIKNGTQTLETIPWYQEQKVYKGNELIYPFFDAGSSSNHKKTSETFISFFGNGNPSTINLYEASSFKYGSFRKNDVTTAGSCTDISATPVGNVMAFNINTTQQVNILKNPYDISIGYDFWLLMNAGSVTRNTGKVCNSLCIDSYLLKYGDSPLEPLYQAPGLRVEFGGVFLASKNITSVKSQLLKYESGTTTVGDEPSITSFTTFTSQVEGNIIASFDSVNLWYVHSVSSSYELDTRGLAYIKPVVPFNYDPYDDDNWHIQAVNMRLCSYLEEYY